MLVSVEGKGWVVVLEESWYPVFFFGKYKNLVQNLKKNVAENKELWARHS
jgi:hypothetical protein